MLHVSREVGNIWKRKPTVTLLVDTNNQNTEVMNESKSFICILHLCTFTVIQYPKYYMKILSKLLIQD